MLLLLFLILMFYGSTLSCAFASEGTSDFWPGSPLFRPLLADPREAHTALKRVLGRSQWEGALGGPVEFVQWGLGKSRMGWGITGAAFIWLDQHKNSFPMRDSDWWMGTYFSSRQGPLSQKFEYTHVSSHLGDALSDERRRVVYSREMFRLLAALGTRPGRRGYLGMGYWVKSIPGEKPWFFQSGIERFWCFRGRGTLAFDFYGAVDLKYKQEAGGIWNKTLQTGIRLRRPPSEGGGIRFGVTYQSGKSEFGQFYTENDTHWTFGVYFN